jgi:hypothetical protein
MQPNFSFSLYRSKPNKCASACADTVLASAPIHYLPICIIPRSLSDAARKFNGSNSLDQILPENTSNIYGGIDAAARGNQKKIAQERMIYAIESGKLFVVALSNLACQNACDT